MLLSSLVFMSFVLNLLIFLIMLPITQVTFRFTCSIQILRLCATSSSCATVRCLPKLGVLIGDGPHSDWLLTCLERLEILILVWLWLLRSVLVVLRASVHATTAI